MSCKELSCSVAYEWMDFEQERGETRLASFVDDVIFIKQLFNNNLLNRSSIGLRRLGQI